jgi:hypothetical protein
MMQPLQDDADPEKFHCPRISLASSIFWFGFWLVLSSWSNISEVHPSLWKHLWNFNLSWISYFNWNSHACFRDKDKWALLIWYTNTDSLSYGFNFFKMHLPSLQPVVIMQVLLPPGTSFVVSSPKLSACWHSHLIDIQLFVYLNNSTIYSISYKSNINIFLFFYGSWILFIFYFSKWTVRHVIFFLFFSYFTLIFEPLKSEPKLFEKDQNCTSKYLFQVSTYFKKNPRPNPTSDMTRLSWAS